ncbi:MAG: Anaerobic nitric oxide reductase transcription regulator NorR [Desulfovibrio sp.]
MSIAFIAPYESLHRMALEVIAAGGYPAKSYIGDIDEGVAAARNAMADGAKVIISRGGTARLIREELHVDPLEVGFSSQSILEYVHEHTNIGMRIAIVGYRQILNAIEPVCRILKRQRATFELGAGVPSAEVIERVAAWRPDIVLGDAVSVRLAKKRGLPCHLVDSDVASLTSAFERGMLMLSNINRHLSSAEKLSAVLDCTQEGTMLVNGAGVIEEINRRGCLMLGAERGDIIGADIRQVFPSEEVQSAVAAGKNAASIILSVGSKQLAVSVVPTMPEKDATGTVILFQQVEEIQEAESNIRKQMLDKGFFAKYTFRDIKHKSPVMKKLVAIAKEYSATKSNIMIQGETGTGKELFAQSIHNAGPLVKGPFVAVNCAALPGTLMESELFGYAPGAFTGALRHGKTGLFELAHGGTLFLDEISEMDVLLQARLLRAIQAREIMRLGDNKVIPVKVRIIAATNKNPAAEVAAGRMRADLFFRLNVLDLIIPPLREREGDAPFLFQHYLGVYETKMRRRVKKASAAFLRELEGRYWPGNVRELENLAEKYVTLDGAMAATDLRRTAWPAPAWSASVEGSGAGGAASPDGKGGGGISLDGSLQDITTRIVKSVLEEESGKVTRTAARLGVDRNTIRRWLEKIDKP